MGQKLSGALLEPNMDIRDSLANNHVSHWIWCWKFDTCSMLQGGENSIASLRRLQEHGGKYSFR